MIKEKLQTGYGLVKEWAGHSLVRQYGSGAAWMVGAQTYWTVAGLFTGILVARTLGPHDFGILNYAVALTGIFALLVMVSVNTVVIRQLVREPEKRDEILGAFAVFRGMLFLLMMILLIAALYAARQTHQIKVLCLIIAFGYIGYITQPIQLYFTAEVQNKYLAIGQIVTCSLNAAVRLLAVMNRLPLAWYAVAEMITILFPSFIQTAFYWRRVGSPLKWRFDIAKACKLFKPALLLSFSGIVTLVYAQTDQVMLKYFLGAEAVGFYAIAAKIVESGFQLGLVFGTVFFPAVVSASKISVGAYHKQLHRLYFMLFWIMVLLALFAIGAGYPFVYYLYGKAFLPSVPVVIIYACMLPCTLVLTVFTQWAVNENLLKLNAAVLLCGILINIMLNYVWIPLGGIKAAAWSSVVSMPLGLILVLVRTGRGRAHLKLIFQSLFTLPSFKLGEHDAGE